MLLHKVPFMDIFSMAGLARLLNMMTDDQLADYPTLSMMDTSPDRSHYYGTDGKQKTNN
jgi:hypothetical protein